MAASKRQKKSRFVIKKTPELTKKWHQNGALPAHHSPVDFYPNL